MCGCGDMHVDRARQGHIHCTVHPHQSLDFIETGGSVRGSSLYFSFPNPLYESIIISRQKGKKKKFTDGLRSVFLKNKIKTLLHRARLETYLTTHAQTLRRVGGFTVNCIPHCGFCSKMLEKY